MNEAKKVWETPQLVSLDVEKTLSGVNITPVETQTTDGDPFGGPEAS